LKFQPNWQSLAVSAKDAVSSLVSGQNIFVHGAAATPTPLLEALCDRQDLDKMRLYHLHTMGPTPFVDLAISPRIHSVSFFSGASTRDAINQGRAEFMPIFLFDIPNLFTSNQIPLDAAFVQVSPPDHNGTCTLGTSVDIARSAVDSAKIIIAEINQSMPRTHGNTAIAFDKISAFTLTNRSLPENELHAEGPVDSAIGQTIADLIEDKSTLQLGIGSIPNAVLRRLNNKHDLGLHTEMFSDNTIALKQSTMVA
jgi:4-hydroxybutyrate CoA-transferase